MLRQMTKRDLTKERKIYYEWLTTFPDVREPRSKAAMTRHLGVHKQTVALWDKELAKYNSRDFFLAKKREVDEGILTGIKRGNAQMAKLAKQISGELVEKTDNVHRVVLTADDYSRLSREAEGELREELPRIREMPPESNLLLDEVRKD